MKRGLAAAGSAGFFLLAPGTVAGLIPWLITGWRLPADPSWAVVAAGDTIIVLGLAALVACFARFAWQGRGTPAPVAPTERLVTDGLYRHVRNPMYVAVVMIILGQAVAFASLLLAVYLAVIAMAFHLFVVGYEEPRLRASYPEGYGAYSAAVPRWLPRLRPWGGGR